MEKMIEAENLHKVFPGKDGEDVLAVDGIDLDVFRGEIFSLLGPNGAGKSTTISMIAGLIQPTQGDARIGGFSITSHPLEAKRLIGVVPQEVALYPTLTGRQNLEFFGKLYDLRGTELQRRVAEVLDFIDLEDRADFKVETYSGGMKRRVNIGVGLLHRPELVFMDEPTVGIDPQSRRRILDTVVQLRDEFGMTVLYTTHLMEEAQELSDRVGIIDTGKIIALGTQGELTQLVGEEDRLIFTLGDQAVPQAILTQIESDVFGVTRAIYDPPGEGGEEAFNDQGQLVVCAGRGRKVLPEVIRLIDNASLEIQSVEVREPDLEAVFLNLTGRALRK